jgi:hypothetical protein
VFYVPGAHTLSKEKVGSRYVCLAIRTFVNPNDAAKKVREALLSLAAANGGIDSARMFGAKGEVDPVQHLIGTAAGWGGNPPSAALDAGDEPERHDGTTVYRLTVKDVPVDGFWSKAEPGAAPAPATRLPLRFPLHAAGACGIY